MISSKYRPRFNFEQINQMKTLYENGYGIGYIARQFKCYPNNVWHHVYRLDIPRQISRTEKKQYAKHSKLTEKEIIKIRNCGRGSPYVAKMYNISQSCALGILNGKMYRWIKSTTRKNESIVPIDFPKIKRKTDLKPGLRKGQPRSVPHGTLILLSKKYKVAPCTIRRWILKKKINKKEIETTVKQILNSKS